jgi:hypothetical protein
MQVQQVVQRRVGNQPARTIVLCHTSLLMQTSLKPSSIQLSVGAYRQKGRARLWRSHHAHSCKIAGAGVGMISCREKGDGTHTTDAPSAPSEGSAAESQMNLGRLLPAWYLKLGTRFPFPFSTISPRPPFPALRFPPSLSQPCLKPMDEAVNLVILKSQDADIAVKKDPPTS